MVSKKKCTMVEDTHPLLEEIKRLSLWYVQNTLDRNAKLEVNAYINFICKHLCLTKCYAYQPARCPTRCRADAGCIKTFLLLLAVTDIII